MEHDPHNIFKTLIETIPSPIFYKDTGGRYLGCNRAFEDYIGVPRDELVGKTVFDVAPEALAARYKAKDDELLANPGTQVYEARVRYADGGERDVEFHKATFTDERGAVAGLVGVILDVTDRKRAERDLSAGETKYRTIFETLYDIYYRAALDGTIEIVSPSVLDRAGYRPEELVGRNVLDVYADPAERQALVSRLGKDHVINDYEIKLRTKGGAVRQASLSSRVVFDRQGNPVAFEGMIRDVDDRKRAETALRESEERYRRLVDELPEYLFIYQEDRIVYANRTALHILGYTLDQLASRSILTFVAPKDRQLAGDSMRRRLAGENVPRYEIGIIDGSGEERRVIVTALTVAFNGRAAVLVVLYDITVDREMERALRHSESKFRMLVEHQGEGIVHADFDELITYANPAGEEIFGVPVGTLAGRRITEFIAPEASQRLAAETARRRRGEKSKYELEIVRPDGQHRMLLVTAVPQAVDDGGIAGTMAILQDVTEQRRAQDVLRVSEEKYRSLFSNMLSAYAYHRIVMDETGRPVDYVFLEINEEFERSTGLTRGDIIGRRVTEVMPDIKEDPFDWIGAYGAVALDGRGRKFEQYSQQLDKWFAITAYSPARGFFVTVFEDVTERRRREMELRKLSAAVEQSGSIVVITGVDANIIYVNQAFCDVTGYAREDVIGRNPRILKSGHTQPSEYQRMWRTLKEGATWKGEFHNRRKDGTLYWEQATISVIRGERGTPIYYMAIKEDITEQRRTREALATSEQRFQQVSASSGEWVWETDRDGRYTFSNGTVADILGYQPDELMGMHFSELFVPEERDQLRAAAMETFARHEPIAAFVNVNVRRDGRRVTLETNGVPFFDAAGTFMGYRGTDKDITMRRALEEERERLIAELQDSLDNIKTLKGLVPICASCKKIRDDKGYWQQVEVYVSQHTEADFSHGLCDECAQKLYPEYFKRTDNQQQGGPEHG